MIEVMNAPEALAFVLRQTNGSRRCGCQIIGLDIVFGPMIQVFDLASAFPENLIPLFGPML
ncbi:MAG: hypothetical protein EOP23_21510 [Hyphomicrobiales bacterium]|nr:MAG: hypothetical protein EOP23_21510 [Hyphomicrobiales bacterium]